MRHRRRVADRQSVTSLLPSQVSISAGVGAGLTSLCRQEGGDEQKSVMFLDLHCLDAGDIIR